MELTGIALQGLVQAQGRVEQVARKFAAGVAPPASNTAEAGDHVDLSRDITELLVARESFEANIKVLETIDEIDGHVLDLLA